MTKNIIIFGISALLISSIIKICVLDHQIYKIQSTNKIDSTHILYKKEPKDSNRFFYFKYRFCLKNGESKEGECLMHYTYFPNMKKIREDCTACYKNVDITTFWLDFLYEIKNSEDYNNFSNWDVNLCLAPGDNEYGKKKSKLGLLFKNCQRDTNIIYQYHAYGTRLHFSKPYLVTPHIISVDDTLK